MESQRVLIAGGSSGMGLELARQLLEEGCEVAVVGRSEARLREARAALQDPERLHTWAADITDEAQVAALFARAGPLDHIVSTAADIAGAYELLPELPLQALRRAIDSKLVGPLLLAKHGHPQLRPGGSIHFVSGIAAYRPRARGAAVAAVNGALASLAYALAVELAPTRVNVVSPGWVDSPIWQHVAGDAASATLAAMAERLPVGRVGRPRDIAEGLRFAMRNGFMTGTVLHLDGGHRLV